MTKWWDYSESPTYFSQILKADLAGVNFPGGFTLIQYVDDLLSCSRTELDSQKDTFHLLQQRDSKGYKLSNYKVQSCSFVVKHLDCLISRKDSWLIPKKKIERSISFLTSTNKKSRVWLDIVGIRYLIFHLLLILQMHYLGVTSLIWLNECKRKRGHKHLKIHLNSDTGSGSH